MKNIKIIFTIVFFGTLLLLNGCGGGGSSSSTNNSVTSTGIVSGSLYEGAKVCLDANANGICDSGEISTTSGADGTFSITGDETQDIVAQIPTTAIKHEIQGDTGTKVSEAFVFLAPRKAIDTSGKLIVSAISTKVWSSMKENGETLDEAKESVATSISGIDAADLLENFNGTALSSIKKVALQARANSETINIKASMTNGVLALATLKTKMTQDVIKKSVRNSNIIGLSTPKQVDAINAAQN